VKLRQFKLQKLCKVCWEEMEFTDDACPACGLASHQACSDNKYQCVPKKRVPWLYDSPEFHSDRIMVCNDCVEGDE
jgi:predicted amidophosphoribosyltransferase